MNLYYVKVLGPLNSEYASAYILAENSSEAYRKYRDLLDTANIGAMRARRLDSVHLLASNDCGETNKLLVL